MSGPYLESGESIVLTTDRVSLDKVIYDAILTTRQLILIDSQNARFEPRIILLSHIQTVRSGKAATGEPVVIVTHQQTDDTVTGTSIILFMQEPLENRKHDRDIWVKKLIELSVSGRVEHILEKTTPPGEGMHPSVRRRVAPDITRPRLENFPEPEPKREMIVTMDEPEPATHPALFPGMEEPDNVKVQPGDDPGPVWPELPAGETTDNGAGLFNTPAAEPELLPVSGQELHDADLNDRESHHIEVCAPEQLVSQRSNTEKTPVEPGSLTASILTAVQSLTVQRDSIPPPATDGGIPGGVKDTPHDTPLQRTSLLPEKPDEGQNGELSEEPATLPSPDIQDNLPVFDEIHSGVRTSSQIPDILPEPVGDERAVTEPVAGAPCESEQDVQPFVPDRIKDETGQEPSGTELGQVPVDGPEETAAPAPAGGAPVPGSAVPSGSRLFFMAGGLILCILLVIGAILFMPGTQPLEKQPVMVVPTPVPATTALQAPTIIPSTVPQEGIWVRIDSPAYYSGEAGNPGYLQTFSGPGEKYVRILQSDGLVQVSVEKQDYTSEVLLVEIYTNGTLVTSKSTTAPGGSIVLLIDPATGNPPGVPPQETRNATGTGRLSYF